METSHEDRPVILRPVERRLIVLYREAQHRRAMYERSAKNLYKYAQEHSKDVNAQRVADAAEVKLNTVYKWVERGKKTGTEEGETEQCGA